jgi:glycerophosphoryl diester phosphodiesterase
MSGIGRSCRRVRWQGPVLSTAVLTLACSLAQEAIAEGIAATACAPVAAASEPFVMQLHRGAGRLAPENTMEAFELAWWLGAVPEADVRATQDGVMVAFHDDTFERLVRNAPSGMRRQGVRDVTWEQLCRFDVGMYKGRDFAGQRIPRIVDVFAAMRGRPARRLYLDVKEVPLERLAQEVRQQGLAGQVILASTVDKLISRWKELLPDSHTLLWMGGSEAELTARLARVYAGQVPGVTQLQIHVRVGAQADGNPLSPSPEFLARAAGELRRRGILFQVLPWGCRDGAVYRRLLELGAASFATDEPLVTLEAVWAFRNRSGH